VFWIDTFYATAILVLLKEPVTNKLNGTMLVEPYVYLSGKVSNGKAVRVIAFLVNLFGLAVKEIEYIPTCITQAFFLEFATPVVKGFEFFITITVNFINVCHELKCFVVDFIYNIVILSEGSSPISLAFHQV